MRGPRCLHQSHQQLSWPHTVRSHRGRPAPASPCSPAVSRWKDDRLVEQVQAARADKLPIVLAHETRPQRGGCQFSRFFETTPQVLVAGGLYKELAIACIGGAHRDISLRLLAMALGAKSSGGGQSCLPRFALHGRAAQPQAPNP